jgi:hypothetical protein
MAIALSADRVGWLLWNWERWMRSSRPPGLLSKHSSGFAGFGAPDLADMEENVDREVAKSCDAAIDAIPDPLRLAVYATHGLATSRIPVNLSQAYAEACALLAIRLNRRGLT